MTIGSTTVATSGSTGNGVTTQFSFTFNLDPNGYGSTTAASQVQVIKETIATGAESVLTLTTDYSVSVNADQGSSPGGSITMVSAPSSAYKIWIRLNPDFTQQTDYQNQGGFLMETVEDQADQQGRQILVLADRIRRAPRPGIQATAAFDGEITGDLVAGAWPVVKSNLLGYEWTTSSGSATSVTATGSTTARTLAERFSEYCNVLDYGAVADCTRGSTGVATSSDATFTDASAAWTAADVGKAIVVHGAGAAGISLITTIASLNSATSIELTAAPSTSVASNCKYIYGTDNRAAFQAAIDEALDSATFKSVFIPDGDYFFNVSVTSLDPGAGDISIIGQSREATKLSFYEGPDTSTKYYLFKKTTTTRKGDLSFENIQFKGTLSQYARNTFGNPLYLDFYSNVSIRHCKFYDLAGAAMDFHSLYAFSVYGCHLEDIGRDGLRCRDTPDILAIGNVIKRVGDDAIAFHTADYQIEADLAAGVPIRERIIVEGNSIVNAGTVKVLGGKKTRICGNVIHLCNVWGIRVHANPIADSSEGGNPIHDILIADNIITDTIYVDSATPQTAQAHILVSAHVVRGAAATNNIKPMRYNSSSGAIVRPWDWYQADESDSAYALPPTAGIVIRGNICRRTLPNAAAFSDWGYGTKLASGTAYDPAMDDTDQRITYGIRLMGSDGFHGALISNNVAEHTTIAIALPESSADELGIRNVQVLHNQLHDFTSKGINIDGADAKHVGLVIQGNLIDGDFYRVASNSNINGTYDADSDPTGIDIDAAEGVTIRYNDFANVCRLIKCDTPEKNIIENNTALAGTPAALGFSTSNKGIGNILSGYGWRYKIAEADPTAGSTFNEISTVMLKESSAMPSTGWYYAGWEVKNSSPALGAPSGWLRLTTGTSHAISTDWLELYHSASFQSPRKVNRYYDDFIGDTLRAEWGALAGTDAQCVAPVILAGQSQGQIRLVTGDDAAVDMATNGSQLVQALNWVPSQGGLRFEVQLFLTDITDVCVFAGFTDKLTLEMPFELGASDTLTSNATDACGFLFDTAADTDNIWLVGVANGVDATKQNSALAYVANTARHLRMDVSSAGAATFYIDGTLIGTTMTGAVTQSLALTPTVAIFSRAAASKQARVNHITLHSVRA